MKKIYFLVTLFLLSLGINAQTTIDFEDESSWIPQEGLNLTAYGNHSYQGPGILFEGTNILRQGNADQDGFPGAFDSYAIRIRNVADAQLLITIPVGGVVNFSFKVRRWDDTPAAEYTVEYTEDGTNWTSLTNIDATLLQTSDWYDYSSSTINSSANNFKIRIVNTSGNERIMIDNFTWTPVVANLPTLTVTAPSNNAVIYASDIDIEFVTTNFELGVDGKVKYQVNSEAASFVTASPISLTGLSDGDYTVSLELVDMSEQSLDPAITTSVSFTINSAGPTITPIYDIQYTTDPLGNSPLANQEVTTVGVVSAIMGDKFWLQDGTGAWNGVYVYYTVTPGPQIGDSVMVNGTVVEYNELTEISPVASMEIINSGNTVSNAVVLATGSVAQEQYESILVQVTGVCVNNDAGFGMFVLNDGSGDILIDDAIYAYTTPVLNNSYTVTGVLYYSYGEWKILPRNVNDMIDNGAATTPIIIVNYPENGGTVYQDNVEVSYTVNNFVLGTDGSVAWSLDGGATSYVTSSSFVINGLTAGEHTLRLELVDMSHNSLSNPVVVNITFTVDLSGPTYTDIYDIQYTTDPSGNSPLNNQEVWIHGVVSANFNGSEFGEGYYVQQGQGAWNGIYIYDLVNSPSIGDSVVIAGTVYESFGFTEIKNVTYFSITAPDGIVPNPVVVATGNVSSEQYEGCLVKVEDATCIEANLAYGQWKVDDGSGPVICEDNGIFDFTEVLNAVYDITGVMQYAFSKFSLNYRRESDIVVVSNVEPSVFDKMEIYPNPASDYLKVYVPNGFDRIVLMEISGKVILDETVNSENYFIDFSNLSDGMYFVKIYKDADSVITKVVKE